jgi:hypothetical protein
MLAEVAWLLQENKDSLIQITPGRWPGCCRRTKIHSFRSLQVRSRQFLTFQQTNRRGTRSIQKVILHIILLFKECYRSLIKQSSAVLKMRNHNCFLRFQFWFRLLTSHGSGFRLLTSSGAGSLFCSNKFDNPRISL